MWTYASRLKTHLRKGGAIDTFVYTHNTTHSARTTRIEHALNELDDIGLSDLAPAIIESVVDMVTDAYNNQSLDIDGEDSDITPENAKASAAQEIIDRLNRRIEHIKNNSNWLEPYSKITELREIGNAFEELADAVMSLHIAPDHEVRLSISVKKSQRKE
jgi:hypothetical protein